MSASTATADPGAGVRAAVVLLAVVLAHAFVFDRVERLLSGTALRLQSTPAVVRARLVPAGVPSPPASTVEYAAQPAASPASPPAPQARRSAAAVAAAPAIAVDPAPPAAAIERAAVLPLGESRSEAGRPAAAADHVDFEATGTTLLAALRSPLPPSLPAAAHYAYRTTYSDQPAVIGSTTVDWSLAADGGYRLRLATAVAGLTTLELESRGRLRAFGLAPDRYVEARSGRGAAAANFDWDAGLVTFSARAHGRPLADGAQDRISFQFQLMWLGQAMPERFGDGRHTVLRLAGRDDMSPYRFRATGRETTATGIGEVETVRLERVVEQRFDARIELWLAPDLGWLPVRLRFTDRRHRVTESVLESVS
jgi:hypothetical protein